MIIGGPVGYMLASRVPGGVSTGRLTPATAALTRTPYNGKWLERDGWSAGQLAFWTRPAKGPEKMDDVAINVDLFTTHSQANKFAAAELTVERQLLTHWSGPVTAISTVSGVPNATGELGTGASETVVSIAFAKGPYGVGVDGLGHDITPQMISALAAQEYERLPSLPTRP
jgi:hypothetical protein